MGRRRAALEDPAAALAEWLVASGLSGHAARLREFLPGGDIARDDHRASLRSLLDQLAADLNLSAEQRSEARRLAAIAADLPTGIGRTGIVWIAWNGPELGPAWADAHPGYIMSWQPDESGDYDFYEDGPDLDDLRAALEWAALRTDRIVVRPQWDPGTHYSAGAGDAVDGFPPLPFRD